jgi:hypothetical protein
MTSSSLAGAALLTASTIMVEIPVGAAADAVLICLPLLQVTSAFILVGLQNTRQ